MSIEGKYTLQSFQQDMPCHAAFIGNYKLTLLRATPDYLSRPAALNRFATRNGIARHLALRSRDGVILKAASSVTRRGNGAGLPR